MTSGTEPIDQAIIYLDADQGAVLFEFLMEKRETEEDSVPTPETAVLDSILSQLERQLVAPFRTDWSEVLAAARLRLTPEADV